MSSSRFDQARSALTKGVDAAGQVGTAAAEVIRVRRDPVVVATRQVDRARRRVVAWSVVELALAALGTVNAVTLVQDGASTLVIMWLVFSLAALVWVTPQLGRAIGDLRSRRRSLRALPPAQPSRPSVAGLVRPQMQRLGDLSDGLRSLVGLIGWVEDDSVLAIRTDLITSADAAERRLRQSAATIGGLLKAREAAGASTRPQAQLMVDQVVGQIDAGVAEYARLVAAATEIAAASAIDPGAGQLGSRTESLLGLAQGMRELSSPS